MPWKITAADSEVLAVHAALLPTGKIIYFTGNQYSVDEQVGRVLAHCRFYDCATDQVSVAPPPSTTRDVFCCGHTLRWDGHLIIAGGTEPLTAEGTTEPGTHAQAGHVPGIRDAWEFDPFAGTWSTLSPMQPGPLRAGGKATQTGGRWYPTLTTLESGEVIAFGGHPGSGDLRHHNNVVEILRGKDWKFAENGTLEKDSNAVPLFYPRLVQMLDGGFICLGGLGNNNINVYGPPPHVAGAPRQWYGMFSKDGNGFDQGA